MGALGNVTPRPQRRISYRQLNLTVYIFTPDDKTCLSTLVNWAIYQAKVVIINTHTMHLHNIIVCVCSRGSLFTIHRLYHPVDKQIHELIYIYIFTPDIHSKQASRLGFSIASLCARTRPPTQSTKSHIFTFTYNCTFSYIHRAYTFPLSSLSHARTHIHTQSTCPPHRHRCVANVWFVPHVAQVKCLPILPTDCWPSASYYGSVRLRL